MDPEVTRSASEPGPCKSRVLGYKKEGEVEVRSHEKSQTDKNKK